MMRRHRHRLRHRFPVLLMLMAVFLVAVAGRGQAADVFEPAFAMDAVDVAGSELRVGERRQAVSAAQLAALLGIGSEERPRWEGGRATDDGDELTVAYTIRFKTPQLVGSMLLSGTADTVRIEVPGKGWQDLARRPSQSGGDLYTLPPGTTVSAVMASDTLAAKGRGISRLSNWWFFKERLHNLAPASNAYADREYTRIVDLQPPHTFAAADVVAGRGPWLNVGKDEKGKILAPPVCEEFPSWFMLTWDAPVTINGLWLYGNLEDIRFAEFVGAADLHPRIGTPNEWRALAPKGVQRWKQKDRGEWIAFAEPITTRGLRLSITKVGGADDQVAAIDGLHVIQDLGNAPPPEAIAAGAELAPPPVTVAYELPWDGEVTIAINGPDGRRVRNLVAREPRSAGAHTEGWDLTDDGGVAVAPGAYKATVLAHPPLDLRYQFTVYPNVGQLIPENSAWQNGRHGPGGWTADHAPPSSLAVGREHLYIGSRVAESGVSLIETDLEGRKSWGYHTLHEGFGGPWFLATDDQRVYVAARATMLWSFEIATKAKHDLLDRPPSAKRQDQLTGMAARDGKVLLAQGPPAYLLNAFGSDDVDLVNCLPKLAFQRKEEFHHDVKPDPQTDLLRLLRLQGSPPGHRDEEFGGLTWLESTEGRGANQFVVVAFKRPVPIGSLVLPRPATDAYTVSFSTLKADAAYPPNPAREADWTPFETKPGAPWDVLAAPENTVTRGLRIKFSKAGADLFDVATDAGAFDTDTLLNAGAATTEKGAGLSDMLGGGEDFRARLEGLKILRRRYTNAARDATVQVSSGSVGADGVWRAERQQVVSPTAPATYTLSWASARKLRGLAIKEMDGKRAEIDVYTGAGTPDPAAAAGWETVGTYQQAMREYYWPDDNENTRARYLDGYIPFPHEVETRAVRIRIVEQYVRQEWHRGRAFRYDLNADTWDGRRVGLYGVAALEAIGGEPAVDPLLAQRIEELDGATGKVLREVPIANPGALAYAPDGTLYGVRDREIVRIDLSGGQHAPVITDLEKPTSLAVGPGGRFYVFDAAEERQNIRIYSATGALQGTLGRAGGRVVPGDWLPDSFRNVTALGVDPAGKLWVVEASYAPKRVSVWDTHSGTTVADPAAASTFTAPTFVKHFLGPTAYGGGGMLDPWSKRRFFYGPMEFALDWEAGTSHLVRITHEGDPDHAPQLPIRVGERRFLTSHPGWDARGSVGIVYLDDASGKGDYRLAAAFGVASDFPLLNTAAALDELGLGTMDGQRFIWTDRNGDGQVQKAEVDLQPLPEGGKFGVGVFNRRLESIAGPHHHTVTEYLPNGVPVFAYSYHPELKGEFLWHLQSGNYHRMHSYWAKEGSDAWMQPDGTILATYPSEPNSGFALPRVEPYSRDQVVAHFKWIGDETVPTGDLGEFVVMNSNTSRWHLFTADGLLAGQLFADMRAPEAVPWSMKEHARGLQLRDVNIGQEHFEGYFTRTFEDDKFYAVAGHNHASIVEVGGLDQFKRWEQPLEISLQALIDTETWRQHRQRPQLARRAPVIDCYRAETTPKIDGQRSEWPPEESAALSDGVRLSMAYDDRNLYLCYTIDTLGPMANTGEDWRQLFKTGAACDLLIGTDPDAPLDRRAPAAGDTRILLTIAKGVPTAVLYQPMAPDATEEEHWTATSPVHSLNFDRVRQLPNARIASRPYGRGGYVLEAAIPLRDLGLKPREGLRLKLDWGILRTGPDGFEVLERLYWANHAARIIADTPSEARLTPDLWGHVLFHAKAESPGVLPGATLETPSTDGPGLLDGDLKDLLGP